MQSVFESTTHQNLTIPRFQEPDFREQLAALLSGSRCVISPTYQVKEVGCKTSDGRLYPMTQAEGLNPLHWKLNLCRDDRCAEVVGLVVHFGDGTSELVRFDSAVHLHWTDTAFEFSINF